MRKSLIIALLSSLIFLIPYTKPQSTAEGHPAYIKKIEKISFKTKLIKAPEVKFKAKLAVYTPPPKKVAPAPSPVVSGGCSDWLVQAGIAVTSSALALINSESGCNPNAVNPSSGACGIAQELPCGKSGCGLGNPVCQLKWMDGYTKSVYGSWDNAYSTWLSRSPHWY